MIGIHVEYYIRLVTVTIAIQAPYPTLPSPRRAAVAGLTCWNPLHLTSNTFHAFQRLHRSTTTQTFTSPTSTIPHNKPNLAKLGKRKVSDGDLPISLKRTMAVSDKLQPTPRSPSSSSHAPLKTGVHSGPSFAICRQIRVTFRLGTAPANIALDRPL